MIREKEYIEQLIVRYLNGEATPSEAIELLDWRSEKTQNEEAFLSLEKTHSTLYPISNFKNPNKKKSWSLIEKGMVTSTKIIPLWKKPLFYIGIAAAVLISFIVISVTSLSNDIPPIAKVDIDPVVEAQNEVIVATTSISSYTLKDQSKITLQLGSKLTIPANFNTSKRTLTLDGSGTFNVVHDEKNPFILYVDKLQIIDIGTIFHVTTHQDTVKVVVEEGEVELYLNGNTLALEKGDSAFYLISKEVIARYKLPEVREDTIFVFDGTNLQEVTEILSGFYHRKIIIIDDRVANCSVSVTFKNETLATILDIIRELLDLTIVQKNKTIEIYGNGCI